MSDAADIGRLARLWDERLRRDMSRFDMPAPEIAARRSVLRDPATEADIQGAETRLGVTFPPAYRTFLLCSDGAHASSLGPELQLHGDTLRNGLLPVEEIDRLDATEDGRFMIDLWTGPGVGDVLMDPERDRPPIGDKPADVHYYAPLRHALLISRPWDAFKDLLVPRAGCVEWEFWTFAKEGAVAYRSFAAFLRHQLSRPDRRPNPELADLYAAEVRDGNRMRLDDLAEIGDPRVAPLAFAHMLDPTITEAYKVNWPQPLGNIADPGFVDDLRRVYAKATSSQFRIHLLAALIRCGDPDIEDDLRQLAAHDPDKHLRRWAQFNLDRLDRLRPRGADGTDD